MDGLRSIPRMVTDCITVSQSKDPSSLPELTKEEVTIMILTMTNKDSLRIFKTKIVK